ncbi:MAG: transposase [Thermomicrobiales bacterium]
MAQRAIGIDVGVKTLLTLSNGIKIDQHKSVPDLWKRLDQHERHLSEQVAGSNRSKETERLIASTKEKIRNAQQDHADKIANLLCKRYKVICIERTSIGPHILTNAPYKKAVERANWPVLFNAIRRKAGETGTKVVEVAPHYTSQTCSKCGNRQKLELHVRDYECPNCGIVIDRDINAAINIRKKGVAKLSKGHKPMGDVFF